MAGAVRDARQRLQPQVADLAAAIEHFGSTAVPGLAAKPVIDLDIVVHEQRIIPHLINRMETLGYRHEGDLGVRGREAFRAPDGEPMHHVYAVVQNSKPHRDHVLLRDYLRRHPRPGPPVRRRQNGRRDAAQGRPRRLPGGEGGHHRGDAAPRHRGTPIRDVTSSGGSTVTDGGRVSSALRAEADTLVSVLDGLQDAEFELLTPCPPWTVRQLLAHVVRASDRLPGMLADPEPQRAKVTAVGYFCSDARFAPDAEAERISWAQRVGDSLPAGKWIHGLGTACQDIAAAAEQARPGRRVRTRWGDTMLLTDYLVTRVVEFGVHGLDFATALGRRPWLTGAAADAIADLLGGTTSAPAAVGWDTLTFIGKATGRIPLTDEEAAHAGIHHLSWLALRGEVQSDGRSSQRGEGM